MPFKTVEQQREYDRRRYALNLNGRRDYKKMYNQKEEYKEYAREYHRQLRNGPRRQEILQAKKNYYHRNKTKPRLLSSIIGDMLSSARRRAKIYNLQFDLTEDFIFDLIKNNSVCPVFGTPFDFSGCRGTWNFKNNAYPSLDRLNPDKGYVKDNIRLISWRANEIKHDSTLDELRAVVRWMESQGAVPGGH